MKKYIFATIVALVYLIAQIITLQYYGMNWDSPVRFMRGQAYVQYFLTSKGNFGIQRSLSPIISHDNERVTRFDSSAIEGNKVSVALPERPLFLEQFENIQKKSSQTYSFYEDDYYNLSYFLKNDGGHPPFPDIIAAFSNRIFYQTFHLVDDVDAYQLADCLFGAIGIFIVFIFTYEVVIYLGLSTFIAYTSGFIAAAALGLFPLFFGDSHFNMKEPLVASMYAGIIWSFWKWFVTSKNRWGILFFVFLAISLSTKWNVVLLPLILLPWIALQIKSEEFKKWFKIKKLTIFLVLGIILSLGFVVVIWPWTWSNPIEKLFQTFVYYKDLALQSSVNDQPPGFFWLFGINLYPLFLFLVQSQELTLFLALAGLLFSIWQSKKSRSIGILLFLWLVVPIAKMMPPEVWFYNGMRQEIEAVPALAVLAGLGVGYTIQNVKSRIQNDILRKSLSIIFCLVVFILLMYPIINLFPNENLYFNNLVGGEKGAFQINILNQKKNYGNIYKQAADWINSHADKNADVAILTGNEFALSPVFLRPDISLSPYNFSGFAQKGEYDIEVYDPWNPRYFAYKYLYRFLNPVYTKYIDGAPIFKIFHNTKANLKPEMTGEKTITNPNVKEFETPIGKEININLGLPEHITKIVVDNAPKICQKKSLIYGDEVVGFYLQKGIQDSQFVFNDKIILGGNRVLYSFPASPGQVIVIHPVDSRSCFTIGHIASVSFLP